MITHAASGWIFWGNEMKIKLVANTFYWNSSRFLCQNFSFYFVLVFWITIILVLVLWKRRPIIIVIVLIFVTKITLPCSRTYIIRSSIAYAWHPEHRKCTRHRAHLCRQQQHNCNTVYDRWIRIIIRHIYHP